MKAYYPHDAPLSLAQSVKDSAPNWDNYAKLKPFKIWVSSSPDYDRSLFKAEKAKKDIWVKAGIYNAIMMSSGMPDPDTPILSALAFFWSTSINAFHFPCGMMSPTLQDVSFITGLRPHGIEANDGLEPPKVSFES